MTHASSYRLAIKALLCIGFVIMLLGFNAYEVSAQNTKGDRPEVRSGGKRENRFSASRKKSKSKPSFNRVKPRRYSPASSARLSKPTKSNRNFYNSRNSYNNRSVSGKVSRSSRSNGNARSVSGNLSRQNNRSGGRISPGSASGRHRNFFPQRNRFVNNRSTAQRSQRDRIYSNRTQVARAKRFGTKQNPPIARGTASPRTASRPFISRKSTTPFAGFWNRKPKGEKPYTKGDLAGRPLRTKNFESRKPVLFNPTANPYRVKHSKSDRPYNGPIRGGYVSRSQSGRPWKGDIAGRKIKGRNYSSKRPAIGGARIFPPRRSVSGRNRAGISAPLQGRGNQSVSGRINNGGAANPVRTLGKGSWNNKGRAIAGRNAGANGNLGRYSGNIKGRKSYGGQGGGYSGNIKTRKREKGGGSISGGGWNNSGRAIAGRNAGANGNLGRYSGNIKGRKSYSSQGETYTGNIKARKREKGGGSISGAWNNNGRAVAGRYAGGNPVVSRYQGNVRFQRKEKGGGSISGSWNNKGQAIAGRNAGGNPVVSRYQGNVKFQRKEKGGGSISGSWNNKGQAIAGRYPGGDAKVSKYSGMIKAKPKPKGGGSVSGKFWNNNEQSTTVRNPNSARQASFQGNLKAKGKAKPDVDYFPGKYRQFDLRPSMRPQGEEYTGNIKLSRFKKNYMKSPHQSDKALKKDRPDKTTYLVNGLQIKVKEKNYKKRPNAADGSMPGIAPGKNSIRASQYTRVIRQDWNRKHNPSSAKNALKVREPGKAFLRATDYQGNIKMKRFDLFKKDDRYPDSRFVKTNKNNTDEERSLLTNFKLWWARLFKKNENQPDNLKEKGKKPRYDKGEKGLWYD